MAEGPVDKLTAHVVQNYQITREISRDALSRLFQATSPALGTAVLIQVIPGDLARDAEFADRFQSRMRKAGSLAHRNILHINHYVHEAPNFYLVLDYFDGNPLSQLMETKGRLPVADVVNYLNQALEGLDHAHKNGLAHGALHPGSILIAADGELRMTGFGIAKAIDPQSMLVETPANPYPYKSPEQIMGLPVDARSDIYSLGLIVYQALTARLPEGEAVPPPSASTDGISAELDEVVLRMLVSRPRDRFRTARQVAIALSGVSRAQPRRPAAVDADRQASAPRAPTPSAVVPEIITEPPTPAARPSAPAGTSDSGADQGIAAFRQGNIEDAIRMLEDAAEAMPRSVRVLAHLGAAYYAAKRYADAADVLKRALEVRPDLSVLRYDLGNALLALGKVPDAKAEFQKAWDADPACTAALLMLVSLEGAAPS
jgi:serine/threonine protein kinase